MDSGTPTKIDRKLFADLGDDETYRAIRVPAIAGKVVDMEAAPRLHPVLGANSPRQPATLTRCRLASMPVSLPRKTRPSRPVRAWNGPGDQVAACRPARCRR